MTMLRPILLILFFILALNFLSAQGVAPEQPSNYHDPDAGRETNPYLISTLANLRWLSECAEEWWVDENTPVHFLQTADIDASETISWNDDTGRSVGSGVYFYQMKTSDYIETKKMILMK